MQVRIVVNKTAPQPLSITAAGGKIMQINALKHPIAILKKKTRIV